MDYFDEMRQMQRIFDEANALGKLYRDLDITRKLSGPSHRELQSAFGQVELDKSLATHLRVAEDSLRSYFDSPAYKLTEALEDQIRRDHLALRAAALTPSTLEILKQSQYEDWFRDLARATRQVVAEYDLARRFGIDRLAEEYKRNSDLIRNVQAFASPVLGMLANELFRNASTGVLNPALVEGFGADLVSYLSRADGAATEEELVGLLQALLAWLIDHAKRLPGTKLNFGAVLSIFLTVVSLIHSQHLSNETERQITEAKDGIVQEVQRTESKLLEELRGHRCHDASSARKEYVVVENARLRQGPGMDQPIVRTLPPNLVVEEIGREGDWTHVEFFDYVEGTNQKGWIATELLVEKSDDEEAALGGR